MSVGPRFGSKGYSPKPIKFSSLPFQVKTLVQIISRAQARWVRNPLGNTLIFAENGPFAGTVICLSGLAAVQLPLRLFNFAPL